MVVGLGSSSPTVVERSVFSSLPRELAGAVEAVGAVAHASSLESVSRSVSPEPACGVRVCLAVSMTGTTTVTLPTHSGTSVIGH